jgi:hypothetical protein
MTGFPIETLQEFLRCSVGRHRKSTREREGGSRIPESITEPNDTTLYAAPCGSHRMSAMCRTQHDQALQPLRVAIGESKTHHTAVRGANEGMDRLDLEMTQNEV